MLINNDNRYKTGGLTGWAQNGAPFPLTTKFNRELKQIEFYDLKDQQLPGVVFSVNDFNALISRSGKTVEINSAGTWLSKSDARELLKRAAQIQAVDACFVGYLPTAEELGWCLTYELQTGFRVRHAETVLSPLEFLKMANANLKWFEEYADGALTRSQRALRNLSYYDANILIALQNEG